MIRVLIVDDEPTTRNSLKEYISWNSIGVDTVELARNGLDALNISKQYPPDILICDIRMPKMDGLELATNIREMLPKCKIIFLSGYCDKEYLKTAIKLKAVTYIEKPICIDEVSSAVKLAANQYNEDMKKEKEIDRLKEAYDESLPIVREHLINGLIFPNDSAEFNADLKQFIIEYSNYQCYIVSFSWNEETTESEIETLKKQIIRIPYELTNKLSFVCGFTDLGDYVYVAGFDRENIENVKHNIMRIFGKIRSLNAESFSCSMGIGPVVSEAQKISYSYSVAKEAVNQRFYSGEGHIHNSNDLISTNFQVDDVTFEKFRQLLENRNIPDAIGFVKDIGGKATISRDKNIDFVKNVFFNLLIIVNDVSGKSKTFRPDDVNAACLWQKFNDIFLVSEIVNLVILEIQTSFEDYVYYNHSNIRIYEIIMFIRAHFSEKDLTIHKIADHMYISPTYLCAIFKKSTGKTLNEYITEVRIEKAKKLLSDSRKKLYEVAEAVGFSDPNYFSTIFKKSTGYTPSDFRERVRI
jgi:two-component system, response regulator YesN